MIRMPIYWKCANCGRRIFYSAPDCSVLHTESNRWKWDNGYYCCEDRSEIATFPKEHDALIAEDKEVWDKAERLNDYLKWKKRREKELGF